MTGLIRRSALILATGGILLGTAVAIVPAGADTGPNTVRGWGVDEYGSATAPAALTGKTTIKIVSSGFASFALTSDGKITTWGDDYGGLLEPPGLLTGKTVVDIAMSEYSGLAVTSAGRVVEWGSTFAQDHPVPTSLSGKQVVAVAIGNTSPPESVALALTSDGTVTEWGDTQGMPLPPSLTGQTISQIAVGAGFALALTVEGTVIGWGANDAGQATPPAALEGRTVTAIAAGYGYAVALTSDGQVVAWGVDQFGQTDVPASLTGKTVTAIASSGAQTLALTADGAVTEWGSDPYDQAVPSELTGRHVTAIFGGGGNDFAVVPGDVDLVAPRVYTRNYLHKTTTDPDGLVVTYPAKAYDGDTRVPVTCDPASGSRFPVGVTTVTCTATDASGNTGRAQFEVAVTLQDVGIDSFSPMTGPASGGTTVAISGRGFTGATVVRFGRAKARFQVDSDTQITAVTPQHEPGRVQVRVKTPEGTLHSGAANPNRFDFLA